MRHLLITSTLGATLLLGGCGGQDTVPTSETSVAPIINAGPAQVRVPSRHDLYLEAETPDASTWMARPGFEQAKLQVPQYWQYTSGTDDGAIFCTGWCTEERCGIDCVDLTEDAARAAMEDAYSLTPPGPIPPDPRDPHLTGIP